MQTSAEISIKGRPIKVPALEIQGRAVVVTGKWLKSASVFDEEWLAGEPVEDPNAFLQAIRACQSRADVFSFASSQPDSPVRYDYYYEWDNAAVIRAGSYEKWWAGLSQDARRNVRLAEKRGVKVEQAAFDDDFVSGIKRIYDETPIRQGRRFWHYGKDEAIIRRENGTYIDRSIFIGAYFEGQLIGFIKMVLVGKTARIMQILSMNSQFEKKPGNAMIAKAVELASKEGMSFVAYCRYVYGNKRNSSITEFKRRNGFEELRFPRYYVPLTLKGRMAIKCGVHLGLKNILPEKLTDRLLSLRSVFYNRCVLRNNAVATVRGGNNGALLGSALADEPNET